LGIGNYFIKPAKLGIGFQFTGFAPVSIKNWKNWRLEGPILEK
jgi:hypothetical protein